MVWYFCFCFSLYGQCDCDDIAFLLLIILWIRLWQNVYAWYSGSVFTTIHFSSNDILQHYKSTININQIKLLQRTGERLKRPVFLIRNFHIQYYILSLSLSKYTNVSKEDISILPQTEASNIKLSKWDANITKDCY